MVTHEEAENAVKRGVVIHLAIYIVIAGGLVVMNVARNPHHLWSLWVLGGWGLGVALHAVQALVNPRSRERMLRRATVRLESRQRH